MPLFFHGWEVIGVGILRESMIRAIQKDRESGASIILKMIGLDGGKGSGNFGHKGRPGQVGGSGKGGGSGEGSGESSGSTEPSYPQTKVFKGIASKARKYSNNKQKWLDSLSSAEASEIHAQKALTGSKESNEEYFDRMYRMMVAEPGKVKQTNKPVVE